ncbi:MAG: bifunctional metallophosphatase/5'-nucleotidase [Thermoplasmatota archaeon]
MKEIILLQINDTHGYLSDHGEMYWKDGDEVYKNADGFHRIAGYFKKVRDENPGKVLALDNGDTIHGTYPVVETKGEDMVPILNELTLDAWTAHWDFAYGPENLIDITEKLNYPLLACNCYDEETGELVFEPYKVFEKSGITIGVIGIAATIVDKTMPDHFSTGIELTMGKEELPGYIKELREEKGADLIVVLSHLGYPQELQLCEDVDGIDVMLSGHTHNRVYHPVKVDDTIVIQSGCHGSFIGRLDISIDDGVIKGYDHELVDVDSSIPSDEKVKEMIDDVRGQHTDMLDTVIGHTKKGLNRYRVMESTMDNLLLRSMLDTSGAEMAFSNGWRYGAPIPPDSDITMNDIWNIIPTNPPISTCKISGEELWNMFEENLELTFSRDPYNQMGGYIKRCMGINVYFKVENPRGKRIQEFFVGDERLKMDKMYDACFVTIQGIPEEYGKDRKNLDIKAVEALKEYIEKNSPLSIELEETVVGI